MEEGYVPEKIEMARAEVQEKIEQLNNVKEFKSQHAAEAEKELEKLKMVALSGGNIFAALMTATRVCSLGQISDTLYQVGGQYRRNV